MAIENYVLENSGNTTYGTVYYIRQAHRMGNATDIETLFPRWAERLKREIGKYQNQILQELFRLGIKDIFDEGSIMDFEKSNVFLQPTEGVPSLSNMVRDEFANRCSGRPNKNQLNLLYDMGAALVYAVLAGGVRLHKTETKELNERGGSREREIEAVRNMSEYFSVNPSSQVVLIFGGNHEFLPYITKAFNPRLYSVRLDFDERVLKPTGLDKFMLNLRMLGKALRPK